MEPDPRIPAASIVFGYGPMLPLVAAGIGVWVLPGGWPVLALMRTLPVAGTL